MSPADENPDEPPRAKVFISYSRVDSVFAGRLEAALKAKGFEPLIDREEIYAFEKWWRRIEGLITECDTVLFVLSPNSVSSPVCADEVAFAASLNKRFAPVVCEPVNVELVSKALSELNFITFDHPDRFDENLQRLCEALDTAIDWVRN